ncbi:uncharacterized protein LOC126556534 [Anopheles maculipalpis]|uniref:uncharacterized protein LOC126556534 n=1 Tax=Anopheles maculipalpis TaxID=1496333 RepID=UPI0021590044|nr:uncharacterized protein LOC126556534 [Anopheles maculipalpis]
MNYVENLLIYARNLSPFYIFSMVISVCVVLLTAYLGFTGCSATLDNEERNEELHRGRRSSTNKTDRHKKQTVQPNRDSDQSDDSSEDSSNESEQKEQESEDEATRQLHIESLGQLKSAKLKSIEKSLTDEQRQAEKEIERAQLAAIFELLKKQADSSNLNEDDLKEQLSLYR